MLKRTIFRNLISLTIFTLVMWNFDSALAFWISWKLPFPFVFVGLSIIVCYSASIPALVSVVFATVTELAFKIFRLEGTDERRAIVEEAWRDALFRSGLCLVSLGVYGIASSALEKAVRAGYFPRLG